MHRFPVGFHNILKLGGHRLHGYLISAICTPLCRMEVNALTMFADICVSVPVMT